MFPYANNTLAFRAVEGLKKNLHRTILIDRTGLRRTELKADRLLAAAAYLARHIRKLSERRIGIVLPPGMGGWVANLAVALAGKSAVNLNFTVSRECIEASMKLAGVKTIISVDLVRQKMPDFPWEGTAANPVKFWDLKKLLSRKRSKFGLLRKLMEVYLLPTELLAKRWHLRHESPDAEAMLLFSSGSTGTPKGIPLTHRNILTNLQQVDDVQLLPNGIKILAALPLFHSFGLTVTLWYTTAKPATAVSYTSPLEVSAIAKVTREEGIEGIVGTASFFRLYMRSIAVEDFKSVKFVVAGAEKTPKGLHEAWQKTFGSVYLEGYGLTETAPVASVNLPHQNKVGTVGKLINGMEARIVDQDTREIITTHGLRGVLELKGDNVFAGYLNEEGVNRDLLRDGWFHTGDLGSIDAEGYITIDGRLKRFSKIAGEMVPHGAIEEAIVRAFGWVDENILPIAVTGMPDAAKGEAIVVVSEKPINLDELREKLQKAGLPNLWIPKKIIRADKIPHLMSGKLDLQGLKQLVDKALTNQG